MAISTKAKLPRISQNQCAPIITLLKATNSSIKIKFPLHEQKGIYSSFNKEEIKNLSNLNSVKKSLEEEIKMIHDYLDFKFFKEVIHDYIEKVD